MKENDVAQISEQFGLTPEIVEASANDGTLGQQIKDALKDQVVYKSQSEFDAFKANHAKEVTNSYYSDLVEKGSYSKQKLNIENKIDPSLMGGFILKIGDMQLDCSVSNQLKAIKSTLTKTNTI